MTEQITSFSGAYRFLSNFYPATVRFLLQGRIYYAPTVEHAFQASKTMVTTLTDPETVEYLTLAILSAPTPGAAKAKGRRLPIDVAKWDAVALDVMQALVWLKFQDSTLGRMLLDTEDAVLVEGNHWGDQYWGQVDGIGENHLGKILMQVRKDLRDEY